MKKTLLASLASIALSLSTSAAIAKEKGVTHDITDPDTVAIVNGKRIPAISADIMVQMINRGRNKVSMGNFMQGALENILLVEHLKETNTLEQAFRTNRVGFDHDIAIEDQYVNIVRIYFEKELVTFIEENFKNKSLEDTVITPFTMSSDALLKHTKLKSKGTLGFIPEQEEAAKKVVLMEYKFPKQDKPSVITLHDIYVRQNIQGIDSLHKADVGYVESQLRQRMGSLFVHYWVENHSDLSDEEIAVLKELVYNKHLKKDYLVTQGLATILHIDNHRVSEVAKTIPKKDILAYFEENKDDYRIVTKAKGRTIQSKDEKALKAAFDKIRGGDDFSTVAKAVTESKDEKGNPKIDTGWVTRENATDFWLQTLLYTQPLNEVSRPFRSPQLSGPENVFWLMVVVDEREMGYQKPDEDGVQYEIAKVLAEKKIADEFYTLRDGLFAKSRIQLNPDIIGLKKKTAGQSKKGNK